MRYTLVADPEPPSNAWLGWLIIGFAVFAMFSR